MHETKTTDHRTNDQPLRMEGGPWLLIGLNRGVSHMQPSCILTSLLGGVRGVLIIHTLENLGACLF